MHYRLYRKHRDGGRRLCASFLVSQDGERVYEPMEFAGHEIVYGPYVISVKNLDGIVADVIRENGQVYVDGLYEMERGSW